MILKKYGKLINISEKRGKDNLNFIYIFKGNHKYIDKNSIHSALVKVRLEDRGFKEANKYEKENKKSF